MDHKQVSVTALIRDDQGRVLLVKQTYGHLNWELPGGKVEAKESLVDAVVREVWEEAGLHVEADHVAGLYDEQDLDFLHVVFACHAIEPSLEPRADLGEVSACGYWALDALPRPISGYTVRRIQEALQSSNRALPIIIRERHWFE